jgi:lipopolysaccharide export system ATP-binding protein
VAPFSLVSPTARHLSKTFQSRRVVRDVCLDIRAGEVVGLLGPNGAGKTTSFHMIVGLVPVDDGRIELYGADITQLPIDARAAASVLIISLEKKDVSRFRVAAALAVSASALEDIPDFGEERLLFARLGRGGGERWRLPLELVQRLDHHKYRECDE